MKTIKILGHKLKFIKLIQNEYDDIVCFSCRPDCCTTPYGIKIEMSIKDYNELEKKIVKER